VVNKKLLHDLLNGLTVISAHCEIMREKVDANEQARIGIILAAANRMANAIQTEQKMGGKPAERIPPFIEEGLISGTKRRA
jgi:hypothetical protein